MDGGIDGDLLGVNLGGKAPTSGEREREERGRRDLTRLYAVGGAVGVVGALDKIECRRDKRKAYTSNVP